MRQVKLPDNHYWFHPVPCQRIGACRQLAASGESMRVVGNGKGGKVKDDATATVGYTLSDCVMLLA